MFDNPTTCSFCMKALQTIIGEFMLLHSDWLKNLLSDSYMKCLQKIKFLQTFLYNKYIYVYYTMYLWYNWMYFSRVFDSLCPVGTSRTRKRLCVILFTREAQDHDEYRQVEINSRKISHYVFFTYLKIYRTLKTYFRMSTNLQIKITLLSEMFLV